MDIRGDTKIIFKRNEWKRRTPTTERDKILLFMLQVLNDELKLNQLGILNAKETEINFYKYITLGKHGTGLFTENEM